MALVYADNVFELVSAPAGGNPFAISTSGQWQTSTGAINGFQTFANTPGVVNGSTFYITAKDSFGNVETDLATYTAGSLARTTILTSSAAGGPCTFQGQVGISCVFPAEVYGPLSIQASGLACSATVQASAALPPAALNVYSMVSASAGVILPTSAYQPLTIANAASGQLLVWPASGASIGSLSANTPTIIYPNSAASFLIATTGQVYVVG